MKEEQLKELLEKYSTGNCTEDEKLQLEEWYEQLQQKKVWDWSAENKEAFEQALNKAVFTEIQTKRVTRPQNWLWYAAACLVLLFATTTTFLLIYKNNKSVSLAQLPQQIEDVPPGVSGAILTLANGKKIVLDSLGNGVVEMDGQNDVSIINNNGELIYAGTSNATASFNTISTPKGKQFRLSLSDGTKVWLNAASELKYPAVFDGGSRKVELTGEAYFEVATLTKNNRKIPFEVTVNNNSGKHAGTINVTGTSFNINAYGDASVLQASLLEGSIEYQYKDAAKPLSPGQQLNLYPDGNIGIDRPADIYDNIAWKNGFFSFDKADVHIVMNQIARWYDIEVEYVNKKIPLEKFWGDIPRDASLLNVLKILELSGVKFTLQDRRIFVTTK